MLYVALWENRREMAEKLTQVEKWMNEVRLLRAEAVALEEENKRLRQALRRLYGAVLYQVEAWDTRGDEIMDMARECLKESGE